jgi:hypothetical protein
VSIPGLEQIRAQLQSLQVKEIDENGSLELVSGSGSDAIVSSRVPVEGQLLDRNGVRGTRPTARREGTN